VSASKLIEVYRGAMYWAKNLERATSCWRANEVAGVEFSSEERTKLHEASQHYQKAKAIYSEVWAARIGARVAAEIRSGEWGAR
jgi:hypothetical protein